MSVPRGPLRAGHTGAMKQPTGQLDPADLAGLTRMDMHCHSRASDMPVNRAVGFLDIPESYTDPEALYDQARARGMDLFTITDHDTIAGALELHERGFEGFVIGEEVSVHFPEDRCLIHVTVWNLTPELHEQIETLGLRADVYAFAQWLAEHNLPHAFAHPLFIQNGRLSPWHLERCALLFKGWELLNGAHPGTHRDVVELFLSRLTPRSVQELSARHELRPAWSRIWHKARTGGSDDHALLNLGRTWAGIARDDGRKIIDAQEFLREVMAGKAIVGGVGGHPSLMAHQLSTVAANWYGTRIVPHTSTRSRYIAGKLLRFAGVRTNVPSKAALAVDAAKRRLLIGRRKKSLPIVKALRDTLGPVLDRYPDLRANLDPDTWASGAPISNHDRMAEFTDELCSALSNAMSSGAVRSIRERDKLGIVDHLISYLIVHAAQLPYLFSLFHQNKERNLVELVEHESAPPGSGISVLERPMRISLFTDTLGDVNGVCRFIQNVAHQANETGRDLQVITSTTFDVPDWPNVYNFKPVFATKMPKYEQLEAVLPPLMKILRHVERHQPDVIHISTPGGVGMIGFLAAKMLRVPVLGVYHTDFPAYIDQLFDDHAFTQITRSYMRFFYKPFSAIFTRSADYVDSLVTLGMPRERMVALMPGLETAKFNTSFRDPDIWERLERHEGFTGLGRQSVKVLYVGRVSVEKNMPLLLNVWSQVQRRCHDAGIDADLVVVGDGPYRKVMQKELKSAAHFLGFRHGEELSTIYASADCFIFPSTTDTLGQVVMESQSSGLPVIVTDQGGPKEVVDHGETGFVLAHDDAAAWVDTLTRLISEDDERRRMGAAAHESMQRYDILHSFEHFWEVHVQAWHEHLKTIGIGGGTTNGRVEAEV
jgi:glycosyltransferase involved in cell wall biosynthesis